jgi:hypothetical protein
MYHAAEYPAAELYLLPEALSRARMRRSPGAVRPARQVAAAARQAYARQLGSR